MLEVGYLVDAGSGMIQINNTANAAVQLVHASQTNKEYNSFATMPTHVLCYVLSDFTVFLSSSMVVIGSTFSKNPSDRTSARYTSTPSKILLRDN